MMQIQHIVTADDPFGEPWPPSDAGLWCVVRRVRGFTIWRSIQLASEPPPSNAQSICGSKSER